MNTAVKAWVDEVAKTTQPDKIVWITGSESEKKGLENECLADGELIALDQKKHPGCFYHRSARNDVARVEHLTFICSHKQEDAGPTNNWMAPQEAYAKLGELYKGCMRGRTMYVIPYLMGPENSPFSKVGIEITDSRYVVLNMRIMARIGDVAMRHLGESGDFVKGLHSKGELDENKRYICHFPEDNTIWSFGSGYGGNALLGKKCFALRIASNLGRHEDWLAEHMLILGLEDKKGEVTYIAAAFPSACGKTNLSMLVPPEILKDYKVWTVGDDIAWMRIGKDGRLWAVNPEAGFFGVAPGTSKKSNPNALLTTSRNTIFTNVLLGDDGSIWWEGMGTEPPEHGTDWKGDAWTPSSGSLGAHPNSRFTAPAEQCPSISPEWQNPEGVPISAIVFGGRRAKVAPLVYQSFDWKHGVFVGATMASETTAAANGKVGVVRRDPMAMLPFCGYNIGDYFQHWLDMGKKIPNPPKIFHVNWFRTDDNGKFIWPGFGNNLRVLLWILARCKGEVGATQSPIGYLPNPDDINIEGLDGFTRQSLIALLDIDKESWGQEVQEIKEWFERIPKLPDDLHKRYRVLNEWFGTPHS
ncbi:MAG: phosphoenolpyruvate carboxykinase [Proteobacteria bacterium]|nr:phosphoenolpyruvate carboxykinase [Pseudomonadota bacterium]